MSIGNVLICQGLYFIHTSHLRYHGGLMGEMCLVNDRYTVRIAQAGFHHLAVIIRGELVKQKGQREINSLYQADDIFAIGKILTQLFPTDDSQLPVKSRNSTLTVSEMMGNCLHPDPLQRPTSTQLKSWTHQLELNNKNIVQLLLERLKGHADELENEVAARTADLLDERRKLDDLLLEMLPRFAEEVHNEI